MFIRISSFALFSTALWLAAGPTLHARPVHKQPLVDYFGPFLPKKLNDCRTCHMPNKPGEDDTNPPEDKPHNPFGARLKAVKNELFKAGKKTSIAARLEAIADEDSDGDGVPNLIELLSGHFPGDPNDKPTPAEIAETQKILIAFRKAKSAYAWTPFETVSRPAVANFKDATWVRNAIDAFIAAEHEQRGLKPRPEATKAVLLRRVYFDLIGLPPTPEELHAFLVEQSTNAYEKVVDRLLASAQYGERWGRHWMDIWRYSDWAGWTGGNQIRDSQPHIWRWRDWIIESLNKDKGYDRMIQEMLAADEICPEDDDALRATGYLVRNYKMLSRETWMQDTVNHTAQAFLGVTLACARCHDHMFDPILQKEYYRVRAIFEPHQVRTDRIPGQMDTTKDGLVRVYDANLQAPTVLFIRGDDRTPDKTPLQPGVPELFGSKLPKIDPVKLPPRAYVPDKREFVLKENLAASETTAARSRDEYRSAAHRASIAATQVLDQSPLKFIANLTVGQKTMDVLNVARLDVQLAEAQHLALLAVMRAENLEEQGKKDSTQWQKEATVAVETQRLVAVHQAQKNLLVAQLAERAAPVKSKDNAAQKTSEAEKALAKAQTDAKLPPTTAYAKPAGPSYPATSTGRRLAFARWIASRENPLTARVAMNHIWLRHFGQAILPSVFDFGRNGQPPSHPALLDWLATEFMDQGWRMKAMHRLIVTSNTYRMASTSDEADVAIDRDNKYLWHMPSRRVEAEVVRDCIFYVAGKLDLTIGGPDIDYQQGLTIPRRSLYFRHAAEKQMEFLKIFDCAAVTECYQRKESILPQQALALANSELTLKHSRLLAHELSAKLRQDSAAFTVAAFERVLSRPPTPQEFAECTAFLEQRTLSYRERKSVGTNANNAGQQSATDPELRARENLVHVLLNHHDFVTIR